MAKNKHAQALFEVINQGRGVRKPGAVRPANSTPPVTTPRWWFGRSRAVAPVAPVAEVPAAAPVAPVAPVAPKAAVVQAAPVVVAAPVAPPAPVVVPAPVVPVARPEPVVPAAELKPEIVGHDAGSPLVVDSEGQQIRLRMSYSAVVISAFALVVVVVLAVLAGRQMQSGPVVADKSSRDLQRGPAHPEVLDVGRPAAGGNQTAAQIIGPVAPPVVAKAPPTEPRPASVKVPPSAPATPAKVTRQVGLNYIVVQSYPDEAGALEVIDLLAGYQVPATIERGLKGFNNNWYTVVTATGFPRISSPEYDAMVKKLNQISQANIDKKQKFKAFTPMGKKWDRVER